MAFRLVAPLKPRELAYVAPDRNAQAVQFIEPDLLDGPRLSVG
jgi:hypothetical protein